MAKKEGKGPRKQPSGAVEPPRQAPLRPSDVMRARRPKLFSDSSTANEPMLTRGMFEYHLETLTNRKQETEFEYLCRRLAETSICPNLVPQTGPTGGGDSKVDSETYPVADAVALRWYEGIGREASHERWAFAFSAKKAWRAKVQSDVREIADTRRDYKLIYFITNQFVRDKARVQVQDSLQGKHGVPVWILDRTWIVNRVFEHGQMALAIDSLHLQDYDSTTKKVLGPRDAKREAELSDLDKEIAAPARYTGVEYQLAEDCLRSALLARALERPQSEVEGRFVRAEYIAERVDNSRQRLRIAYARAWTAFWWYDDFPVLNKLYDEVERRAVGSDQANDLESLANLWTLLNTAVRLGCVDLSLSKLDARTALLKAELERLVGEEHRVSNALWARTIRLLMDLQEAGIDSAALDRVLLEFKAILVAGERLVAYPVEPVLKILREYGKFARSQTFDEVFEAVLTITQRRSGDGQVGRVLLERGHQLLQADRVYDAIRAFGRAQQKLAKREFREDFIEALLGCSAGYEAAGLPWAARSNTLAAANQAFLDFWEDGEITHYALRCMQRLVWLELRLGRVPCALAWTEAASVIAGPLMSDDDRIARFLEEHEAQDAVLGILLLKADLEELKLLGSFPAVLERLNLHCSWMALLYSLGYEDRLKSEGAISEGQESRATLEFFAKWLNQPANRELPERPEFLFGITVSLQSFVLGCEVLIEAENNPVSLYLAETLLGVLEALLATSLNDLAPHQRELRIRVRPSAEHASRLPKYWLNTAEGGRSIDIHHSLEPARKSEQEMNAFRSWLEDLMIRIICEVTFVKEPKSFLDRLIREEGGLARSLSLSEVSIAIENILGKAPKFRPSSWEPQPEAERFPLRRDTAWNFGLTEEPCGGEAQPETQRFDQSESPSDLERGFEGVRHRDRRVLSLINIPLWDSAKWRVTIYGTGNDLDAPPFIALGFKNEKAARQIFEYWLGRVGKSDGDERLRVSIITGIDKERPQSYKVLIGMNPDFALGHPTAKYLVTVSRINRMDPRDSSNIDRFAEAYSRAGRYMLLPAALGQKSKPIRILGELAIHKRKIRLVPAWQLSERDPDASALEEDDDPIIPDDVVEAPVNRVLQRLAKRAK